jgi:hypothetical protein
MWNKIIKTILVLLGIAAIIFFALRFFMKKQGAKEEV